MSYNIIYIKSSKFRIGRTANKFLSSNKTFCTTTVMNFLINWQIICRLSLNLKKKMVDIFCFAV